MIRALKDWWYEKHPENDPVYIETGKQIDNVICLRNQQKTQAVTVSLFQAAVDELDPRLREVLVMHVSQEKNYREIARELKLTQPVVLKRLAKAYAALRMRGLVE
jgi:RNA polymerase sigma factor (sigma-70 family)